MNESVFINDFISRGMLSYFDGRKDNVFEAHIIECLCHIYGRDRMKATYDDRSETEFITLLHIFGMSKSLYDNLLRDMVKYEQFREEYKQDPSLKTDLASKIEITLITMFLYRCLIIQPSLEDLGHFENDLLNNFEIIKLHFNTSINPSSTREIWNQKKRMLVDNVELVEIKPEYLDDATYAKYGTSLKDVKKMDYRMVEELNSYIKAKSMSVSVEDNNKKIDLSSLLSNKTVLSSGNGMVDALLVAAVIATEVSIGLIYMFLHF